MNSVISNNVSLKYQRFATLNSKDIGILNSEVCGKDSIPLGAKYMQYNTFWSEVNAVQ